MNKLANEIESCKVPRESVRLWWLGQAGFAFKSHAGRIIYLDPYLSDAVERLHGFKRLSLAPIMAEEVLADMVVFTHEHADHMDPDSLPLIARRNPDCRFAGPVGCHNGLTRAGIIADRRIVLESNQKYDLGAVVIHTAQADHGDFSATALMLVLDFKGVRVLVTGDTSWRSALIKPLSKLKPDVVLPVINGVFGNMNHVDAAMMIKDLRPRIAIPCHYWTFAEQGAGDPAGFIHACRTLCPEVQALLLKPGEGLQVKSGTA